MRRSHRGTAGRYLDASAIAEANPELPPGGKTGCAAEGAEFVGLEVQGTGRGINERMQAKIFDPFFSAKFLGRGMGLAAVEGFATEV
jgi:signal transduction histidine kinase